MHLHTQYYFKFHKWMTLSACPIWPEARWNRTLGYLGMNRCISFPLGILYSSFLSFDILYSSLIKTSYISSIVVHVSKRSSLGTPSHATVPVNSECRHTTHYAATAAT